MQATRIALRRDALAAGAVVAALLAVLGPLSPSRSSSPSADEHHPTVSESVGETQPLPQSEQLRERGVLDLNLATAGDLRWLPGIGNTLAARIVDTRTKRGGFRSVDDLLAVPGIGPKKLAAVRAMLRVGPVTHSGNSHPTDNVNAM